jgi:hypothetical protein
MKINAANHTWLFVFGVKIFALARSKLQSIMKTKLNTPTD